MKKQSGFTLFELIYLFIVIFGIIGWVWNIVKIANSVFELSTMLVLRFIGIFVAPLGAVLGFL